MNLIALLKNKKFLAIIGFFSLAAILFVIYGAFAETRFVPKIVSMSTPFGTEFVNEDTNIRVTFDTPVSATLQKYFSFSSIPSSVLIPSWRDEKTLVLKPTSDFSPNTSYTVHVEYKEKRLHSLSFTTNPYTTEVLNEQALRQVDEDRLFSDAVVALRKARPWYDSLPIIKNEYVIVYDYAVEKFRIRLLRERANTLDSDRTRIINLALKDLENINVSTDPNNYYVIYLGENSIKD